MRAIKQKWIDMYRLARHPMVPVDSAKFVSALEDIERADNNEKRRADLLSASTRIPKKPRFGENGKAGRNQPGKGGGRRPGNNPAPGDGKTGCSLCKKHGGAWRSHRTEQCRRYNPDGSKKTSFKGKGAWNKEKDSFRSQMMAMREEMGKLRETMAGGDNKRKRAADGADDSSDDE